MASTVRNLRKGLVLTDSQSKPTNNLKKEEKIMSKKGKDADDTYINPEPSGDDFDFVLACCLYITHISSIRSLSLITVKHRVPIIYSPIFSYTNGFNSWL